MSRATKSAHGRSRYVNQGCRCDTCIEANRLYLRSRTPLYKERLAPYYARYRRDNHEAIAAYHRKYYLDHQDHIRKRSAEYHASSNGRLVAQRKTQARRKRRYQAPGHCSSAQLHARWLYYGNHCYICRCRATATDHVIPLSRGGSNWPANLRPICKSCNSHKNNKTLAEFRRLQDRRA
jgi:5-methylcytosine-specific restriction endonuclease McrA